MGPQRRMGIYVGFESPSIIKYLEPTTGDLFTAQFADCHFNESVFPSLGGEKVDPQNIKSEITWNALQMSFLDPRTNSCEQEVKKIVHLQSIANQLPDAFTDTKKVTKSHVPAANAPERIEIPNDNKAIENESIARRKRGRPPGVKPVGYKWVFVRKRNEKNEVTRYKARLVAQGFSQMPGIDYDETYSPVVDATTLRFLSGRLWHNRLSEYLLKEGFKNNQISPCVFIKRSKSGFAIIVVYVDDLNIIGTPRELEATGKYLMKEFEMKDLGKTKFCLGLQMEHLRNGIFVHQSNYTEKILKCFFMDKAHPISSPMVVRSLNEKDDPFRPREENEEILGPEVPYLSAIGALMYLANNTRLDIAFSVNLLARYINAPTKRHWNGVRHLLRYLRGTQDLGLFYQSRPNASLIGYADAGYLSDPQKAKSQSGYLFTYGGTAISWKSTKQTLTATSSNHAELIALYEAGRECVWLRSMIKNIQEECGMEIITTNPTIYEDNTACITQVSEGYIKADRIKHLSPKLFFTHDLQKEGTINIRQIQSCENLADLFTKSLPAKKFEELVRKIGMRHLRDVC
uniref:Reverse transcriptase Ty1/copia-type domain-containing protein n=1 Tax=Beta vulgaris TaxID=161934 RepID=E2DMZ0_BETVU|nr:hypothetical protein [Beta vulgaris]